MSTITTTKVRTVRSGNVLWVEADFDHSPADLKAALASLAVEGWHPMLEEYSPTELTADGNGARIQFTQEI